jgi:hypothetical protein
MLAERLARLSIGSLLNAFMEDGPIFVRIYKYNLDT